MSKVQINCLNCDAKVNAETVYGDGSYRFCPSCGSTRIVVDGNSKKEQSMTHTTDNVKPHPLANPVRDEVPQTPHCGLDAEKEIQLQATDLHGQLLTMELDCFGRADNAGKMFPCDPVLASDADFTYEVKDAPEQGTDKWLEWRKQGITATEAASIMFPDSHNSPMTVYGKKLGLVKDDQSDPDGYMEWGHRIEDLLVAKFMEQHPDFRQCTQGRLYQRDWAKCSLDAQAFDADGNPVIIECKTGQNAGKWNPIPDRYYAQVQWQMYVTGIRKAYFSVLICGHQWFEKVVDFNPVFVGKMLDKCFRVWDCIQLKQAPASLGFTAADKETIAAMAGQSGHSGPAKEVTDEEVAKFKALKEAADRATEEFEAFKNSIQYKMVDAQRLYRPDGRTFASWVERKGSVSVDKDKLKLKYPDIYNECLKTGAGSRYVKYNV